MASNTQFEKTYRLACELPKSIAHAMALYRAIERQSVKLKEAGLIHATGHWRSGKYFCLVYPSRVGENRVIKYVGSDPKKILASQAAIRRAVEYDVLIARMATLERIAEQCNLQLADVKRKLQDLDAFKPVLHIPNNPGVERHPKKVKPRLR